MRRLLKCNL